MPHRIGSIFCLIAIWGGAANVPSHGSLIGVEMAGPTQSIAYHGSAVNTQDASLTSIETASDQWNLITGYSSGLSNASLHAATGAATGVKLSITSGAASTSSQAGGSTANVLLDNYAAFHSATTSTAVLYTVTLSGLVPNANYDLYIYGNNGGANTGYGVFPIGPGTTVAATKGTSGGGTFTGTFGRPGDYIAYSSANTGSQVKANGSGVIAFGVTNQNSSNGLAVLNGLQIVGTFPPPVAPEPGTLSLLAFGCAAGVAAIARRKHRTRSRQLG